MSKQQTAVEWLSERLIRMIPTISPMYKCEIKEFVEQAKAMEKEQMKEMYLKGIANYDPTFKIKESNGGDNE